MILALNAILILSLVIIVYQDLSKRSIHWIPLVLILISSLGIWYLSEFSNWVESVSILGFLSLITAMVFIYYRIKYGKSSSQNIEKAIGLGDVLYVLAIVPLFGLHNFIYFFSAGMVFSLVVFLIVNLKRKVSTIPLAGYLSILLIAVQSSFLLVDNIDPYISVF